MESRIQRVFLVSLGLIAMLSQSPLQAAESNSVLIEPQVERRELGRDLIDTEDFEIGLYYGRFTVEDFGVNDLYGARLAYHLTEDFFLESTYAVGTTQETSFERLSATPLLTDEQRDITLYDMSLGFNLLPGQAFLGQYSFYTSFYLMAGAGITEFAGAERFTLNYGAGYRFFATDWLVWDLGARDHVFEMDILGEKTSTHNLEFRTGLSYFF